MVKNITIKNLINKELKIAKKEKKRCAKLYKDWEDNEFNCGANKFIFGVVSQSDEKQGVTPSFNTINDLTIYYNRDTLLYTIDFETCYINMDSKEYLYNLLNKFKTFLFGMFKVNTLQELLSIIKSRPYMDVLYLVERCSDDYWSAFDLITLFCKFYVFVKGFNEMNSIVNKAARKTNKTKQQDKEDGGYNDGRSEN